MAAVEHINPYVMDLVQDEDEDTLSFRDFPIHEPESEADNDNRSCRSPSFHDFFEFRSDLDDVTLRDGDSATLGRSFLSSSESFLRNQSFRYGSASKSFSSPAVGGYGDQRSDSRRPMALIGLTRTPSRMELSEIRKRQARLAPVPMFHVVPEGKPVTVAGDGGGISRWSLIRAPRYRSVLVRVLAKAASSCI